MVPASFLDFFLAVAGAGGALIGLLFVAISINPERIFGSRGAQERQGVAASAYTGLVNGFFVATGALIPHINAGGMALAFAGISILNSLALSWRLLRYHMGQLSAHQGSARTIWSRLLRTQVMVLGSLAVYVFELEVALELLRHPGNGPALYALCVALLAIYGVSMLRAWELLGAPRNGLLAWLNPLAGLEEAEGESPQ